MAPNFWNQLDGFLCVGRCRKDRMGVEDVDWKNGQVVGSMVGVL